MHRPHRQQRVVVDSQLGRDLRQVARQVSLALLYTHHASCALWYRGWPCVVRAGHTSGTATCLIGSEICESG